MIHCIRYIGCAYPNPTGPLPVEGAYLKSFDPEARNGRGEVEWTLDPAQAARFDSAEHAFRVYRAVPQCHPVRLTDGQPNRPLTAFTIVVEPLLVTKTGKVLSDDDIEQLADEAERGYDVTQLKDRRRS